MPGLAGVSGLASGKVPDARRAGSRPPADGPGPAPAADPQTRARATAKRPSASVSHRSVRKPARSSSSVAVDRVYL